MPCGISYCEQICPKSLDPFEWVGTFGAWGSSKCLCNAIVLCFIPFLQFLKWSFGDGTGLFLGRSSVCFGCLGATLGLFRD